jgi:hypothetical protein
VSLGVRCDYWRKPVAQTGEAPNLGRKADPQACAKIGLTPEVGGCACLNHGLTTVVTLPQSRGS